MTIEFAQREIQWLAADAPGTNYTISGLSFAPKLARFYVQGLGSASDAASETIHERMCVGFATGIAARRCVAVQDQDAAGTTVCTSGLRNDAVVATVTSTPAFDGLLDVDQFNSDGIRLRVDDQGVVDLTVVVELWGGDITATLVDIAEPAATGNVDYSVPGFVAGAADQCVMFAGIQSTAAANSAARSDAGLCVGFATSGAAADNIVLVGNADDASTNADTDGYALDGECLAMIAVAGGDPSARAQLTQFGTDNFRLNWIARATTNRRYIAAAIKGGTWKAGSYTIDATTPGNTSSVSGLSFQPKGGLAIGRTTAEQAAGLSAVVKGMMFGTWTSTSSRIAMGLRSETGNTDSQINLVLEHDQMLAMASTTGTLDAAYDLDAVLSDGFRVIVDDAPAAASATEWQGYLVFGDVSAVHKTATITLDAAIQRALSAAVTLDAAIQQARTVTTTLDAAVQHRPSAAATLDAAIQQALSAAATLDAVLVTARTAPATLDAVVAEAKNATTTLDASVQQERAASATLDAALLISHTASATLDAVVVEARSTTTTLDALILTARLSLATLDAAILHTRNAPTTLDAAILAARAASATLDAIIVAARSASATLDAVILQQQGLAATLDAAILRTRAASASLDAGIERSFTRTALLDAILQQRFALDATLDGMIATGRAENAWMSAAVQRTDAIVASLDAVITGEAFARAVTLDVMILIRDARNKVGFEQALDPAALDLGPAASLRSDVLDF